MENKHERGVEGEKPENAREFWTKILEFAGDDDFNQVEDMILHRKESGLENTKLPGEDEIWQWLQSRAINLGRKLMVELNEKGIIVPIGSEEVEK